MIYEIHVGSERMKRERKAERERERFAENCIIDLIANLISQPMLYAIEIVLIVNAIF